MAWAIVLFVLFFGLGFIDISFVFVNAPAALIVAFVARRRWLAADDGTLTSNTILVRGFLLMSWMILAMMLGLLTGLFTIYR